MNTYLPIAKLCELHVSLTEKGLANSINLPTPLWRPSFVGHPPPESDSNALWSKITFENNSQQNLKRAPKIRLENRNVGTYPIFECILIAIIFYYYVVTNSG